MVKLYRKSFFKFVKTYSTEKILHFTPVLPFILRKYMTTGTHINVIRPSSVTIQIKSFLLFVSCVESSKVVVLELSNMMCVAVVLLEREMEKIHKKC